MYSMRKGHGEADGSWYLDEKALDLMKKIRECKPYLCARLQQIHDTNKSQMCKDDVESIQFYLELTQEIRADLVFGVDTLELAYTDIVNMSRNHPIEKNLQLQTLEQNYDTGRKDLENGYNEMEVDMETFGGPSNTSVRSGVDWDGNDKASPFSTDPAQPAFTFIGRGFRRNNPKTQPNFSISYNSNSFRQPVKRRNPKQQILNCPSYEDFVQDKNGFLNDFIEGDGSSFPQAPRNRSFPARMPGTDQTHGNDPGSESGENVSKMVQKNPSRKRYFNTPLPNHGSQHVQNRAGFRDHRGSNKRGGFERGTRRNGGRKSAFHYSTGSLYPPAGFSGHHQYTAVLDQSPSVWDSPFATPGGKGTATQHVPQEGPTQKSQVTDHPGNPDQISSSSQNPSSKSNSTSKDSSGATSAARGSNSDSELNSSSSEATNKPKTQKEQQPKTVPSTISVLRNAWNVKGFYKLGGTKDPKEQFEAAKPDSEKDTEADVENTPVKSFSKAPAPSPPKKKGPSTSNSRKKPGTLTKLSPPVGKAVMVKKKLPLKTPRKKPEPKEKAKRKQAQQPPSSDSETGSSSSDEKVTSGKSVKKKKSNPMGTEESLPRLDSLLDVLVMVGDMSRDVAQSYIRSAADKQQILSMLNDFIVSMEKNPSDQNKKVVIMLRKILAQETLSFNNKGQLPRKPQKVKEAVNQPSSSTSNPPSVQSEAKGSKAEQKKGRLEAEADSSSLNRKRKSSGRISGTVQYREESESDFSDSSMTTAPKKLRVGKELQAAAVPKPTNKTSFQPASVPVHAGMVKIKIEEDYFVDRVKVEPLTHNYNSD